jgi:hypothetical protein
MRPVAEFEQKDCMPAAESIQSPPALLRWFRDRQNWPARRVVADRLAIAAIASIPWSTSLTGILIVLWLIAIAPDVTLSNLHQALTPASALPILLFLLALAGLLWTEATPGKGFSGLIPFVRLLVIPILMVEFREGESGHHAILAFFVSCALLLALSITSAVWPTVTWWRPGNPGVPFKDQTTQSAEFTVCAFCLLYIAMSNCQARHYAFAAAAAAAAFLADVFYVATSRTELIAISILIFLMLFKTLGWKGLPIALTVFGGLAVGVWYSSPYLEGRVLHGDWEIEQYLDNGRPTSIGLRLNWWDQSIDYWKAAPILGHGTGSIEETFKHGAEQRDGIVRFPTSDPHNQVFTAALQLGVLGVVVLFAMWGAHLNLFWKPGFSAWFGLVIVVQSIVGSLFSSPLSDFTESWTYIFGVGVLGGMVLRSQGSEQQ